MDTLPTPSLTTVLFADIEGYSAASENDEELAYFQATTFKRTLSVIVPRFSGEVIQFYGDGCLCILPSAKKATACAVAMQKDFRNHSIPVRIGIHLGDVLRNEDSIYGTTVNIAARIESLCPAGGILISKQVADQLRASSKLQVRSVGHTSLKNIAAPIHLYAIDDPSLVMPNTIKQESKRLTRSKGLLIMVSLLALLIFLWQRFGAATLQDNLVSSPIVVLPFVNLSGDSTLNYLCDLTPYFISLALEGEGAHTIDYPLAMKYGMTKQFGLTFPSMSNSKANDRNLLEGEFSVVDHQLHFAARLRSGHSGKILSNIPLTVTSIDQPYQGIQTLAERICGFWNSRMEQRFSIPLNDAHKAFTEALRQWGDTDIALRYLNKAIALDSTFIDPYHYVFDALRNQLKYRQADSVLSRLSSVFPLEDLNYNQRRRYDYQRAIIDGQTRDAYEILMEDYLEDPYEIWANTAMSILALEYANRPKQALEILDLIPFRQIDFRGNSYLRDRISIGIKASFILGEYERAHEISQYYPSDDHELEHNILRQRALVGISDSAQINSLIRKQMIRGLDDVKMGRLLYALTRDCKLTSQKQLYQIYARKAYEHLTKVEGVNYLALLQDIGETAQVTTYLTKHYGNNANHPVIAYYLARSAALEGDHGRVESLIMILQKSKKKYDFGRTAYRISILYTLLGEYEKALIKLEQALEEGLVFDRENLINEPDLMPLFDLPEFKRIVTRI